ncbi:hypothetical protein [Algoriphagus sp.]|uniref:hypothetical protein n=1 Tax=Algoriphagus sp. TaxID=1872435 RepID=UPI00391AC746
MKSYSLILLLPLVLLLMSNSCGSDSKQNELKSEVSEAIKIADKASGTKSLDKYTGKLDELLTVQMAAKITGYNAEEAIENYNQNISPKYHSIAYTWDQGRTRMMSVGAMNLEVPVMELVQLDGLALISKQDFEYMNRELTEEDLKNLDQAMNAKMEEKVADGTLSKDQSKMAGDLGKGMMGDLSREKVSGVGELAVWMPGQNSLSVYENGVTFIVRVNLNGDMETSKSKAGILAKEILAKL